MKSSEVLKLLQITRPTLTKYVKNEWIKTTTMPNGHYNYDDQSVYDFLNKSIDREIVIYARVSTHKQKKDLENQIDILKRYCYENGYKINGIYSDIASGISFAKRKQFFELIDLVLDRKIEKIIITYKDRLSRIAFEFFSILFSKFGTKIEVISEVGSIKLDSEEIFEEIIHLIHSFSMKLYSSRKGKSIQISQEKI